MTVLFKIETRKADSNPVYLATVKGVEAGVIGFYSNGVPYTPDREAILEALPHYWRKAFLTSSQFWFTTDSERGTFAHCDCTSARGKPLFSIWATPYEFEPTAECDSNCTDPHCPYTH